MKFPDLHKHLSFSNQLHHWGGGLANITSLQIWKFIHFLEKIVLEIDSQSSGAEDWQNKFSVQI